MKSKRLIALFILLLFCIGYFIGANKNKDIKPNENHKKVEELLKRARENN